MLFVDYFRWPNKRAPKPLKWTVAWLWFIWDWIGSRILEKRHVRVAKMMMGEEWRLNWINRRRWRWLGLTVWARDEGSWFGGWGNKIAWPEIHWNFSWDDADVECWGGRGCWEAVWFKGVWSWCFGMKEEQNSGWSSWAWWERRWAAIRSRWQMNEQPSLDLKGQETKSSSTNLLISLGAGITRERDSGWRSIGQVGETSKDLIRHWIRRRIKSVIMKW